MTGSLLAIDAGQSAIKVRISGDHSTQDLVFPGIQTHLELAPQLAAVIRDAVAASPSPVTRVTAGVSGLTDGQIEAEAVAEILDGTPAVRLTLAHDSITSFLGAIGDARGVVLAAGTGIVTLAVGHHDVARVDGWGNIMGDAGSGYWIGRLTLDHVMRAFDGRGPATDLSAVVRERWPDLTLAYRDLQSSEDRVPLVASFAEPTARAAEAGDAVARAVLDAAADEMAISIAAGARRVGLGEPVTVCGIGGVLRSPVMRDLFEARVRGRLPGAIVAAARGDGLDGATALDGIGVDHALRSHLATVESVTTA